MSAPVNTGGPAFPTLEEHGLNSGMPGMTLRDYFAAKAMQAEMAFPESHVGADDWAREVAELSYRVADAMLAVRQGGAA